MAEFGLLDTTSVDELFNKLPAWKDNFSVKVGVSVPGETSGPKYTQPVDVKPGFAPLTKFGYPEAQQPERGFLGQAAHDIWTGVKQGVYGEAKGLDDIMTAVVRTVDPTTVQKAGGVDLVKNMVGKVLTEPTEADMHAGLQSMVLRGLGQAIPVILEFMVGTKGVGTALRAAKLPEAVMVGKSGVQALKGAEDLAAAAKAGKTMIGLAAPTYFGAREAGGTAAAGIAEGKPASEIIPEAAKRGAMGVGLGTALGLTHKLPVYGRAPAMGGLFGGQTALEGGTGQDIAASTIVGGVLGSQDLLLKGAEKIKQKWTNAPHKGAPVDMEDVVDKHGKTVPMEKNVIAIMRKSIADKFPEVANQVNAYSFADIQRMIDGEAVPVEYQKIKAPARGIQKQGIAKTMGIEVPLEVGVEPIEIVSRPEVIPKPSAEKTPAQVEEQRAAAIQNDQVLQKIDEAAVTAGKTKPEHFEKEFAEIQRELISLAKEKGQFRLEQDALGNLVISPVMLDALALGQNIPPGNPAVREALLKMVLAPIKSGKKTLKFVLAEVDAPKAPGLGEGLDLEKYGVKDSTVKATVDEKGEVQIEKAQEPPTQVDQLTSMKAERDGAQKILDNPASSPTQKNTAQTIVGFLNKEIAVAEARGVEVKAKEAAAQASQSKFDVVFKKVIPNAPQEAKPLNQMEPTGALGPVIKDIIAKLSEPNADIPTLTKQYGQALIDAAQYWLTQRNAPAVPAAQAVTPAPVAIEEKPIVKLVAPKEYSLKDIQKDDRDARRLAKELIKLEEEHTKLTAKRKTMANIADQELIDTGVLKDADGKIIKVKSGLRGRKTVQQEIISKRAKLNELNSKMADFLVSKGAELPKNYDPDKFNEEMASHLRFFVATGKKKVAGTAKGRVEQQMDMTSRIAAIDEAVKILSRDIASFQDKKVNAIDPATQQRIEGEQKARLLILSKIHDEKVLVEKGKLGDRKDSPSLTYLEYLKANKENEIFERELQTTERKVEEAKYAPEEKPKAAPTKETAGLETSKKDEISGLVAQGFSLEEATMLVNEGVTSAPQEKPTTKKTTRKPKGTVGAAAAEEVQPSEHIITTTEKQVFDVIDKLRPQGYRKVAEYAIEGPKNPDGTPGPEERIVVVSNAPEYSTEVMDKMLKTPASNKWQWITISLEDGTWEMRDKNSTIVNSNAISDSGFQNLPAMLSPTYRRGASITEKANTELQGRKVMPGMYFPAKEIAKAQARADSMNRASKTTGKKYHVEPVELPKMYPGEHAEKGYQIIETSTKPVGEKALEAVLAPEKEGAGMNARIMLEIDTPQGKMTVECTVREAMLLLKRMPAEVVASDVPKVEEVKAAQKAAPTFNEAEVGNVALEAITGKKEGLPQPNVVIPGQKVIPEEQRPGPVRVLSPSEIQQPAGMAEPVNPAWKVMYGEQYEPGILEAKRLEKPRGYAIKQTKAEPTPEEMTTRRARLASMEAERLANEAAARQAREVEMAGRPEKQFGPPMAGSKRVAWLTRLLAANKGKEPGITDRIREELKIEAKFKKTDPKAFEKPARIEIPLEELGLSIDQKGNITNGKETFGKGTVGAAEVGPTGIKVEYEKGTYADQERQKKIEEAKIKINTPEGKAEALRPKSLTKPPERDINDLVKQAIGEFDTRVADVRQLEESLSRSREAIEKLNAQIRFAKGPELDQLKAELYNVLVKHNINESARNAITGKALGGVGAEGKPRLEGDISITDENGQPYMASIISEGFGDGSVWRVVQGPNNGPASMAGQNVEVGKVWLKKGERKGKEVLKLQTSSIESLPTEAQDRLLDAIIEQNMTGPKSQQIPVIRMPGIADDAWARRRDRSYEVNSLAMSKYKTAMEDIESRRNVSEREAGLEKRGIPSVEAQKQYRALREKKAQFEKEAKWSPEKRKAEWSKTEEENMNRLGEYLSMIEKEATKMGRTWGPKEKARLLTEAMNLNDSVEGSLEAIDYKEQAYRMGKQDFVPLIDRYADPSKVSNPTMRRIGMYGIQMQIAYRNSLLHFMKAFDAELGWLRSNHEKSMELMRHLHKVEGFQSKDPEILRAEQSHKRLMEDLARMYDLERKGRYQKEYATLAYDNNKMWDFFKKPLQKAEEYIELPNSVLSKINVRDFGELKRLAEKYNKISWDKIPLNDRHFLADRYMQWVGAYTDWQYLPQDLQALIPREKWVEYFQPRKAGETLKAFIKDDYWEVLQKYLAVTIRGELYNEFLTKTNPLLKTLPHQDMKGTWGEYAATYVKKLGGHDIMALSDRKWNAMAERLNTAFGTNKIPLYVPAEAADLYKQLLYRGALGPDTAVRNLTQSMFTWAEEGTMPVLKGMMNYFYGMAKKTPEYKKFSETLDLMDEFFYKEMEGMRMSNPSWYKRVKRLNQKLTNLVLFPLQFTERLNKGIAYFAGLEAAAKKGLDLNTAHIIGMRNASNVIPNIEFNEGQWHALHQTMGKTQFIYGQATTSPFLRGGNVLAASVPFWSFPIKTAQFLRNGIKESFMAKDWAKATRFLMLTGFMVGAPALLASTLGVDASAVWGKGALPFDIFPMWFNTISDIYKAGGGGDSTDTMSRELAGRRARESGWMLAFPQYRWLRKVGLPYEAGITDIKGSWQRIDDKYTRWGRTESPLTETNWWKELMNLCGWPSADRREGREWVSEAKDKASKYGYDVSKAVKKIADLQIEGKYEAANNALTMALKQGLYIKGENISNYLASRQMDAYTQQALRMPKHMQAEYVQKAEEMKKKMLSRGNRSMWGGSREEDTE